MTFTPTIRLGSCGCRGSKLAAVAVAAALAWCAPSLPATAADFVMKFGTATINETQHQFIAVLKYHLKQQRRPGPG